MRKILKIVFVIIGTLIGAGFASGQEIYIFFFSYGLKGIIGIVITSVLMGIIIYQSLNIIKENNIETYRDFLDIIIKNERIKIVVNIIINIFIISSFYIMIAGFGAYIEQEFDINSIYGSTFLSVLCFIIFQKEIRGLVKVNEILIPILIVILITTGIINLQCLDMENIEKYVIRNNYSNWIVSSVLYASYNSILLIPMLVTMKEYIKEKKYNCKISAFSTAIMMILSIIIYIFLINIDVDITNLQMPAVYAVQKISSKFKMIYGAIILVSIFTTAISSGTSFLINVAENKEKYKVYSVIICLTAIIFSNVGFSKLVNLLYPVFGYLGLIQILLILIKNIAKKYKN